MERATRTRHPSERKQARAREVDLPDHPERLIPRDRSELTLELDGRALRLTNLQKVYWPDSGHTKGDLLRYYASVARWLLPHLWDRAMVMRRYPGGIDGESFFMKRSPSHTPEWISRCAIAHGSGNVIDFPMVQDLPSLLWVVNLGCIDLNQWYARCDDVDRPDYLHFDLDPVPEAGFEQVQEAALLVHEALEALGLPNYPKTTGSRGIHVYVPIVRGPTQRQVWEFAKAFARALSQQHPDVMTAEYRIARRPRDRVLVDYNQNAWGRTLASVYSVRPKPLAPVSMPVTWQELRRGVRIESFTMDDAARRLRRKGDLFEPLRPDAEPRAALEALL